MAGIWDALGDQRVRMVFREDDADGRMTVTRVSDPVDGCSIQPQTPTEYRGTGTQVRQPFAVYGPRELAELRAHDAVDLELIPGSEVWVRATLVGPAQVWTQEPANVQLAVDRVAG